LSPDTITTKSTKNEINKSEKQQKIIPKRLNIKGTHNIWTEFETGLVTVASKCHLYEAQVNIALTLHLDDIYSVSQKIPPCGFLTFFSNGWEFLINFVHTYYAFIFTLDYKFLFNYLQL